MHGTALHSTALHRTARHGTARHGTARHGTARHGTALHCTALHCTVLQLLLSAASGSSMGGLAAETEDEAEFKKEGGAAAMRVKGVRAHSGVRARSSAEGAALHVVTGKMMVSSSVDCSCTVLQP